MKLNNNNIIITGGSGDIGRYLAGYLFKMGNSVNVIDICDKKFPELEEDGIRCIKSNLTDYDEVEKAIETINKDTSINILINCAGVIYSSPLINFLSREDRKHNRIEWDRIIKANLYSTFYAGLCVADKMTSKRTKGLIINFSSVAANGNMGQSAYASAKAGVEALTKVWSKELSMFGIRTACIAPGFINTESTANALSAPVLEKIKSGIPLKRLGELEEIANAIRFIIENDYFNGKILSLDGGVVI